MRKYVSDNVFPIAEQSVSRHQRERAQQHRGGVFWLTGLSGSGKSTVGLAVERALFDQGTSVKLLDGDDVRTGLCADLGFSLADRQENVRRIASVAKLFCESGFITLCSFVSPTQRIRDVARSIVGTADFHEVYAAADLATCEARDVKGLYARARAGEISGFTGIDSPYEAPQSPQLILPSGSESVEVCAERLLRYVGNVCRLGEGGGGSK